MVTFFTARSFINVFKHFFTYQPLIIGVVSYFYFIYSYFFTSEYNFSAIMIFLFDKPGAGHNCLREATRLFRDYYLPLTS